MTKYVPSPDEIIAQRMMHLDGRGLTAKQKAQEIIADLEVHGYQIVRTAIPKC